MREEEKEKGEKDREDTKGEKERRRIEVTKIKAYVKFYVHLQLLQKTFQS